MKDLSPEDAQAVDRLAFHLLREAYCDLAGVMMTANAAAARTVLSTIEQRLTDTLGRFHSEAAEGAASTAIVIAVGDKIGDVMDEAQNRNAAPSARKRTADLRR
jgi:hypothetical protein